MRENIEVNTVVHTLSACDPDSEENSRIHYELYQAIAACEYGVALFLFALFE